MKNKLFFLAAAMGMMMLPACTSEEVTEVSTTQGKAIAFNNVVSRAVDGDLTTGNFDQFFVYGYYIKPGMSTPIQIFNGASVSKVADPENEGGYKWVYDQVRYWVPGYTYYFYAYSCGDVELATGKGAPTLSLFDAVNPTVDSRALAIVGYLCDGSHQHDLVTAENENITAKEKKNPEVAFNFKHALCKVKAKFTTTFPEQYKVYVSNVYVSSFYNVADFNVGTNTWTNFTTKDEANTPNVALNFVGDTYVENKAGSEILSSEAFLIPKKYDNAKGEYAKIHFTITVKQGDVTVMERSIVGTWAPQWTDGNLYQYNINITGSTAGIEPIVFSAKQAIGSSGSTWEENTQVNMEFGVDAGELPTNE